ncbi:MAG: hypothetical protein JWL70_344 [Acidimicrobiia bacterium]|nr:hypothetical protein [Acidimicrobiia bacterium]
MKISRMFGAIALTGVISLGGATAAMAAGQGSSGPGTAPKDPAKVEQRCEKYTSHSDQIAAQKTKLEAQMATLVQNLKDHPDRAPRIQVRIDRVKLKLDRIAAVQAWAAAHCPAPAPAPATPGG